MKQLVLIILLLGLVSCEPDQVFNDIQIDLRYDSLQVSNNLNNSTGSLTPNLFSTTTSTPIVINQQMDSIVVIINNIDSSSVVINNNAIHDYGKHKGFDKKKP